jgi:hypothetical protein
LTGLSIDTTTGRTIKYTTGSLSINGTNSAGTAGAKFVTGLSVSNGQITCTTAGLKYTDNTSDTNSAAPFTSLSVSDTAITTKRAKSWAIHTTGTDQAETAGVIKLWTGTYTNYTSISSKNSSTLYFCTKS